MKKTLFVLSVATLFLFLGCSATGYYILSLREVNRPEDAKNRYGEPKIINFTEDNVKNYVYEDELIKITWYPLSTNFYFILENISDHSIKVIWDEAVYVNTRGVSARLVHSGVKLVDRDKTQLPTLIPKKSILKEKILPAENIDYVRDPMFGGYKWVISPLIPNKAESKNELIALSKRYIGKTVRVLLPLQIQDVTNEYIFYFNVDDFILKSNLENN